LVPSKTNRPLGVYLSELDFTQARVSESEKYAHVTYFFDGGRDEKINKCDKFHIPSPAVATYDLKPEMSCVEVTKKVIRCMENDYDFILVNYANPDMVGHTGSMEAATKACTAIDICLGKLIEKAEENFYKIILLADHGNADTMINPDGSPCTTHSTEKVPFIICDKKIKLKAKGDLPSVAPTILDYMDIAIPKEMEETESLLIEE
ncbi:MAG: alkaline phosphatase family protein, partial [Bacilli bacterium]|nr:alkaline phosphatase family protein [Bacilli bacterium]